MLKETLYRITGVDVEVWASLPDATCTCMSLWIWANKGEFWIELPGRKMQQEEFFRWAERRHESCGSVLLNVRFQAGLAVNWEVECGIYYLAAGNGRKSNMIVSVFLRETEECQMLPEEFQVPVKQLGRLLHQASSLWSCPRPRACFCASGALGERLTHCLGQV